MNKKVLIITYYWPPSGGAGVQRWVKFAKYLPEYGWEPFVLTVDPRYAAYPVIDDSLAGEIPVSIKVFTTKATDYFSVYNKDRSKIPSAGFASNNDNSFKGKILRFIRGNFFIPDPRKGWNSFAIEKASELIRDHDIRYIVTTSPPHSTQLIGLKLKKKFSSLRWVADLRDPWTDIYYYNKFYPTALAKMIDRSYEKNVLNNANHIIVVGDTLRQIFSSKIDCLGKKIEIVTNGFDLEDFEDVKPQPPSVFTITYVGTLSDIYPIETFLEALEKLRNKGRTFILRFIGMVSENQKRAIKSKLTDSELIFVQYVSHSESIQYLKSSSALLLIIPDHPSNKAIITGKIFEYIASGLPVICLGPRDGDAAAILNNAGSGSTFGYDERDLISEYVEKLMETGILPSKGNIAFYSRRALTADISRILDL